MHKIKLYLPQNRVNWFLPNSITRCLHVPLFDGLVISYLLHDIRISQNHITAQALTNWIVFIYIKEEYGGLKYREKGSATKAGTDSSYKSFMSLNCPQTLPLSKVPKFHL